MRAQGRVVRRARHTIRIIGGQWRGRRVRVPSRPGLHPSPDRVRETLFNWLGQDLTGWRCVDAFAGSGVLALEAASRGAQSVIAVERDRVLADGLRNVARQWAAGALRVIEGDARAILASLPAASADLIFVDPPYGDEALCLHILHAAHRIAGPGGFVYLEQPVRRDDAWLQGHWRVHRHARAGAVHAHLLRRVDAAS